MLLQEVKMTKDDEACRNGGQGQKVSWVWGSTVSFVEDHGIGGDHELELLKL